MPDPVLPASNFVKDLLVAANVGEFGSTGSGWSISIGTEPNAPINMITVYDEGVRQAVYPINVLGSSERTEYKGVSIRVRTVDYLDGYAKSAEIAKAIVNLSVDTGDGFKYLNIYAQGASNNQLRARIGVSAWYSLLVHESKKGTKFKIGGRKFLSRALDRNRKKMIQAIRAEVNS